MAIYVTGDKHRDFTSVEMFCKRTGTTKEDLLIVLGDAGVNYTGNQEDQKFKEYLERMPITFMFVRGNHEMRPSDLLYRKRFVFKHEYHGSFLVEEAFPSLLFARSGETYSLLDEDEHPITAFVCGGAHSIDKNYRLKHGLRWFSDEQLSQLERQHVLNNFKQTVRLEKQNGKKIVVLTHTCPRSVVPQHALMSGIDQSLEDWTMENFMNEMMNELNDVSYTWYFGHFHVDEHNKIKENQLFRPMFNDFEMLR